MDSQVQQEGQSEALPLDRANQSHLSQHYRNQPSQDDADTASEETLDHQCDHADSEGMISDPEGDNDDDDPSLWLADPPPGEIGCQSYAID